MKVEKPWKTTVLDSNDSNKAGMRFALSQDLYYFDFFVAAAEFRLGFGRWIDDRIHDRMS